MDFGKVRNYLFLGLLGLVTVGFLFILKPFAYPIFWAAVIAALFYPVFRWLNGRFNHPNLSATITLMAVFLIIVLPLMIAGMLLTREAISVYANLSGSRGQVNETLQRVAETIKHNPLTAELSIDESFWSGKFAETGQFFLNYIFDALKNLTQNSIVFVAMFILMLYTLFFFIRDGQKILQKIMYLCPLGSRYEVMLYNKFTSAASAMIKGTLIVGTVQGAIGAVTFWAAGIQGAIIWGVIMVLASIIPGVGTSIIWLPAGIIMLLAGNIWQGIVILLVGALLISTIDNVLRPMLVGKDLRMPPILILFSTLGGIILFGFSGFLIGPIITALFVSFWEMYEEYYRTELAKN